MNKERWEYLKNLRPAEPRWVHIAHNGRVGEDARSLTYMTPETRRRLALKHMVKNAEPRKL